MATQKPLIIAAGQLQQLQLGDTITTVIQTTYDANAGPSQTKTISPSLSYTKSVA